MAASAKNNDTMPSSFMFSPESDPTLSTTPQDAQSHSVDMPLSSSHPDHLVDMEVQGRLVWGQISRVEQFKDKYGADVDDPSSAHCYLFTNKPRIDTFAFEAFAGVQKTNPMKQELVYHSMFERLIERYTGSRAKPNPVLIETRSTEFCYRLTILVEAVPQCRRVSNSKLRLVREYAVLYHIWEKHRLLLGENACQPDILVGIPMPFELVNVAGYAEYDFTEQHGIWHQSLHGEEIPLSKVLMPGSNVAVQSTLSYMSVEKLGPTLHYMVELMKSQRSMVSVSTALKVFDQLLCRLMVLHKYGVILGTLDANFANFGIREASNVLYISRFDCAVVAPTKDCRLVTYNERYAPVAVLKRREPHFVNDIESAFYVFLSLMFPSLPWDDAASNSRSVRIPEGSSDSDQSRSPRASSAASSTALDEKIVFWRSQSYFQRLINSHIKHEFADPLYQGFMLDILTMLYTKTHEALTYCSRIPHADYMMAVMKATTLPNTAYSGLRRIVAAYFHFDSLSVISQDSVCSKKVEFLLREDPVDRRLLWNLNDWCWNAFCPSYGSSAKTRTVSMFLNSTFEPFLS